MFAPLYENSKGHWNRYVQLMTPERIGINKCNSTIHGMVYNAMKLFMEINPQLFDDCSHDYNEHQNNADKREQARKDKWAKLQTQADKMKQHSNPSVTEAPDAAQDNEQRLGDLTLQDKSSMAQTAAVSILTLNRSCTC